MVFAAGLNYRVLVGTLLAALPAAYIVIMSTDYRRRRLFTFLDPWADPLDDGFQIIQSFIAVGTGGVFGRGLMRACRSCSTCPSRTRTSSTRSSAKSSD